MRKSLQLLFTFLTIFIILSLGMMADAKKQCLYKTPTPNKRCVPVQCLDICKKKYGAGAAGSCSDEKGFCNCSANCKGAL
ncbi:hypothetical protein N665_0254s0003 [Sinapis alba]|nr:hypothetical protein N665_0254s0003 [Sinapis alba]